MKELLKQQREFISFYQKALNSESIEKKAKKIFAMYDLLNAKRIELGLEPLKMKSLETFRNNGGKFILI